MLPKRIDAWSLTSLRQRLVKAGGSLVKHARDCWLQTDSRVGRRLFGTMLPGDQNGSGGHKGETP